MIALPLLRQNERRRFWNHEKVLRMDSDEVNGDIGKFFRYMENNWFAKMEGANENIWNFNRLARTRSTNPAEAFHSMIKRYCKFLVKIARVLGILLPCLMRTSERF